MAVKMNPAYHERAAPRCERNEVEERRTSRRSGRSGVETNLAEASEYFHIPRHEFIFTSANFELCNYKDGKN